MDWFVVGPLWVALLFCVAMLAGFIDSIAGGGGMLTVPALLSVGLSPARALATNKLQSVGGSFSASLYFVRRKAVNLREQKLNIAMTFIGAILGATLIQHIQADILRQILPLLLIGLGIYFLLMPKVGEEDRQRRLHGLPFALVAGGCVGFYDGFFGRAQAPSTRWHLSRSAASIWRNRPRTPKSLTSLPTLVACCSLCLAAKWCGAPGW